MVRRLLGLVYGEIRGLHQAAYILAIFTLGSQVLALLRDRLLAHNFGAGVELDMYYAAFRIPDLLFVIFASALSVYVLIPFVTARIQMDKESEARGILSSMFTLFLGVYVAVSIVICIFAPFLVGILFPGFEGEARATLALLVQILLLQPLLLGISNIFGVITQIKNRFVLYALSPILYNLGIIVGIVFFYPYLGLAGLAGGVVLGALLHMLIQIPYVWGSRLVPRISLTIDWKIVREVLLHSIPRTLTLSLHQIMLLVFISIASVMTVGSTSVFQFAFNLQSVPLAIIGVSYSVAAFPTLARLLSEGARDMFVAKITLVCRHIFFWSLPFIVLGIVERAQIIRLVLGTGAFNWTDTRLTAAAFGLFLISLVAQAFHVLLLRGFYAGGNTRAPFFITLASSVFTVCITWVLYHLSISYPQFLLMLEKVLRVEAVPGSEVLVLPLGYTLGLLLHSALLIFFFNRYYALPRKTLLTSFLRSSVVALAGGWVAYILLNLSSVYLDIDTFVEVLIQGGLAAVAGIAMMVLVSYVIGSKEFFEILSALSLKIQKWQGKKNS